MPSIQTEMSSLLTNMLVASVLLAPIVLAIPAIQDLDNLRSVINAAASTIGSPNNTNRGWGFGFGNGNGKMGTADLVNNITTTVLGMKFQIDTNKTSWLHLDNTTTPTLNTPISPPYAPTLPLTSSIVLPSSIPTAVSNITINLSAPYIDYVSALPNLSTSLTSLGRSYHREMNAPVRESISGLQQAISTLQSALLQDNLIGSQAVVRTIRASSTLENAQVAWGRFLNLPGRPAGSEIGGLLSSPSEPSSSAGTGTGIGTGVGIGIGSGTLLGGSQDASRQVTNSGSRAGRLRMAEPKSGMFYSHRELWGMKERRVEAVGGRDGKKGVYRSFVG